MKGLAEKLSVSPFGEKDNSYLKWKNEIFDLIFHFSNGVSDPLPITLQLNWVYYSTETSSSSSSPSLPTSS